MIIRYSDPWDKPEGMGFTVSGSGSIVVLAQGLGPQALSLRVLSWFGVQDPKPLNPKP